MIQSLHRSREKSRNGRLLLVLVLVLVGCISLPALDDEGPPRSTRQEPDAGEFQEQGAPGGWLSPTARPVPAPAPAADAGDDAGDGGARGDGGD